MHTEQENTPIRDLQFCGSVSVTVGRCPVTQEVVVRGVGAPIHCGVLSKNPAKQDQLHVFGYMQPLPKNADEQYEMRYEWRLPKTCCFETILHRAEATTLAFETDTVLSHDHLSIRLSSLSFKPPLTLVMPPCVTGAVYQYLSIVVDGGGLVFGNHSRAHTLHLAIEGPATVIHFAALQAADLRLLNREGGLIEIDALETTRVKECVGVAEERIIVNRLRTDL